MYNKQAKYFKKEEIKQRAWKEIAKELDLKNGKLVEKLLSKQHTKLKEVDAAGPVNKARKAMEEQNWLSWLLSFVKVRKTKSNLSLAKEGVIISV